ncbi:hypothetical protein [uncultured Duncaniella sp.]|uniref:hypothetical protein n=1 Tax=uncultured Duncaniella sp. TaxID=2768039 RepID=UPI002670BBCD|nr:hypothetical protein [uncultured Duncaniella sp.]
MYQLDGLVIINGIDIWKEYDAFLTEEKKGGRENLNAILKASKVKTHVGVDIREHNGTKYSSKLDVRNQERDITLHFAIFAPTVAEWLDRYRKFLTLIKQGKDGWVTMRLPSLGLTMRLFYVDNTDFKPLTYLWKEGVQASRFKVKFREPEPTF